MKIRTAISNAARGWVLLLRGRDGWRDYFKLSASGLATALVLFIFITFLAVVMVAIGTDIPGLFGIVASMVALSLPLIAMALVLAGTRSAMRVTVPTYDMLVPGTYLLMAFVVVEGVLASLIGGPIVLLSWLVLGYLLYRLARAATDWHAGISIGFAVLTVLLLVAMRLALYMLSSTPASPT